MPVSYTHLKVSGLTAVLEAKATTTALNAVKATAEAAAPQATTYTKEEVEMCIRDRI